MGALFLAVEIGQRTQVDHPSRRWTERTAATLQRLSLGRADGQGLLQVSLRVERHPRWRRRLIVAGARLLGDDRKEKSFVQLCNSRRVCRSL